MCELLSPVVVLDHRRCVGCSHTHPLAAADELLGSAGGHGPQKKGVLRSGAQLATDTLLVAWLRGGFGRDAGASSAGFRDQIERLDDVYADVQPPGVPPPAHESLSRECSPATCACALAGCGITPKTLA